MKKTKTFDFHATKTNAMPNLSKKRGKATLNYEGF